MMFEYFTTITKQNKKRERERAHTKVGWPPAGSSIQQHPAASPDILLVSSKSSASSTIFSDSCSGLPSAGREPEAEGEFLRSERGWNDVTSINSNVILTGSPPEYMNSQKIWGGGRLSEVGWWWFGSLNSILCVLFCFVLFCFVLFCVFFYVCVHVCADIGFALFLMHTVLLLLLTVVWPFRLHFLFIPSHTVQFQLHVSVKQAVVSLDFF